MSNPYIQKLLQKEMSRKEFLALGAIAFASVFGIAGVIKELTSRAATPTASLQPENGTLANGAVAISDTTASGGSAVKFSSGTTVSLTNVTDTSATLNWTAVAGATGYLVGRDGVDSTGSGPWQTTVAAGTLSQVFTNLVSATTYNLFCQPQPGGVSKTIAATTTGGVVVNPGTNPKAFKAFGTGSSCVDAPNGNFNRWLGKQQKCYSTWGGDGNIWDILQPTGLFGSNSVASLGDYDIDAAGQVTIGNKGDWSAAAGGSIDATLRSMCSSIAGAWGNRQGYVYLRPWHEFNGSWYNWSIPDGQQANFIATWKRFVSIFHAQFGTDQRFKLEWAPLRDCSYGYNVLTLWPGADYVDCIGLDYYDNFGQYHMTQADWDNEQTTTQNGGPVGITQWLNFAAQQNVPMRLPEWANQYGDEPVFIQNMFNFFQTNRFTGTGSPGGKMIGANYYNQTADGASIATNSDFLIELNGANCPDRPNASALYHSLWSGASWM